MRTDTKLGFIITYFHTSDESLNLLIENLRILSSENYYLVLASHSALDKNVQEMCDYYFYQNKNIVDDRKYSHGVAESNLIEISLNHLKEQGIDWTYKATYDMIINDVVRFIDWINDYKYNFVSCNWGSNVICTNSFFANIDFLFENIDFYKTIDEMFVNNTVLENCWEKNLRDRNVLDQTFAYEDKQVFFGENEIDRLFYDYSNISFSYSVEENKFYVTNNSLDIERASIRIFDYYTDLCIENLRDFNFNKGVNWWIVPPCDYNMPKAINGFYLEVYIDDLVIRKNIMIKDFNLKHPLHKKFRNYKTEEVKFNEFCDFDEFSMYKKLGLDLDEIENFVDIGANYGILSTPFLIRNKKVYLVEADSYNVGLLRKNFDNNRNIKIIDKAIYSNDGEVDFWEEPGISVVSSIDVGGVFKDSTNRIKKVVKCITPNTLINDYVDEKMIDLMKIDIEGAEYPLFQSFDEKSMSRVKKFLIEFHLNEDYRVMEILEKLAFNGFRFKLEKWGKYYDSDYVVENIMGIIYAWK
jgi:FkbM family methyltransferase